MKKTYQIHLRIEYEAIEKLKKQAQEKNITLAELCRLMLKGNFQLNISYLDRLGSLLQKLEKRISNEKECSNSFLS